MTRSFFAALGALAIALTCARRADAWVESHEAGDDVRVTVDPSGVAHFDHAVAIRIVKGPLWHFDLAGVEKNAVVESTVGVTADDGRELSASATILATENRDLPKSDRATLRVQIDEPKAFFRGAYTFHVRYSVDLVEAKELVKDGPMWRIAWSAPVATEGFDGAKAIWDLPPGPTEPRAIRADTGAPDESVIATMRREPSKDELELVRPHVSRGEAVEWTLRVDPKALGEVKDATLRPPPPPPPPPPDRTREAALVFALAALAVAYALLVALRDRAARASVGVLPIGAGARAIVAGALLAIGVGLEVRGSPTLGAALVAAAMIAASLRVPNEKPRARGPGRWLAVLPEEAFVRRTSRKRVWLALLAAAIVGAGAVAASRVAPEGAYLVVFDALALVPLFVTGHPAQLAPNLAVAAAPLLARAFGALKKKKGLRVAPWARVPRGETSADELRLLVLPRAMLPGLLGIEVAVAYARVRSGWAGAPELLVRVQEESCAAVRIASLAPEARPVPGRRVDERVVTLAPRLPTARAAAALAERLARELADRRVAASAAWQGPERRAAA